MLLTGLGIRAAAGSAPGSGEGAGCTPWLGGATSWVLQSPLVSQDHRLCSFSG